MLFHFEVQRDVRGESQFLHYKEEFKTCREAGRYAKVLCLKHLSDCAYQESNEGKIPLTKMIVFDQLRREVVNAIFDAEELETLLSESGRD